MAGPMGSYCPEGSAKPTFCPPGTYGSQESLTAEEQCTDVRPGMWAPLGAHMEFECLDDYVCPGPHGLNATNISTYTGGFRNSNRTCHLPYDECNQAQVLQTMGLIRGACPPGQMRQIDNETETAKCEQCPAGKYQNETDRWDCKQCELGRYCPRGAPTPLPCEEGTYSRNRSIWSKTQCTVADPGYYASTGSHDQTECAPGTYAPEVRMAACRKCEPGKYQNRAGRTMCSDCTEGSYCDEGTAEPVI